MITVEAMARISDATSRDEFYISAGRKISLTTHSGWQVRRVRNVHDVTWMFANKLGDARRYLRELQNRVGECSR